MENITQADLDNLGRTLNNMSIAQLKGIMKKLLKMKTEEARNAIKIIKDVIAVKKGRLQMNNDQSIEQ